MQRCLNNKLSNFHVWKTIVKEKLLSLPARLRRLLKITETDNRNKITEVTDSTESLNYDKKIALYLVFYIKYIYRKEDVLISI